MLSFWGASLFANHGIDCNAETCQPERCESYTPCRLMPAYNGASRPLVNCSWDWYVSGSFIYWEAMQENMEVASLLTFFGPTSTPTATSTDEVLRFDFRYKPGFKLATGYRFGYDHWDLFAEYTWYHTNTMTTSYSASGLFDSADLTFSGPVLLSQFSGNNFPTIGNGVYNFISLSWKLKCDFINLMLARSFYVGKRLTFRPAFGARAAYIRQHTTLVQTSKDASDSVATAFGVLITGSGTYLTNKNLSWGYGLRACLEADWLVGAGIRLIGNGAFDLLYTRYNLSNFLQKKTILFGTKTRERKLDYLRPHAETEFGFGWGDCFCGGKWYLDLEAVYNLQVFWDQSMFLEETTTTLPANDLYLHGMRATIRVDF